MRYFYSILVSVFALGLIQCDTGQVSDEDLARVPPELLKLPPGFFVGEWETLGGYVFSDAPAVDSDSNVYYAAIFQDSIFKISPAGEISLFDQNTARTMGLMFAADGRLIGCRNNDAQIVAYDMQGGREILLQGELTEDPAQRGKMEFCNGLVVSSTGNIWFVDRVNQQVIYLDSTGQSRVVASGYRPNGIILSRDEKMLVTTDSNVGKLWAFDIQADGSLLEKPAYFDPVLVGNFPAMKPGMVGKPGTDGMAIDNEGRYYASSFVGIQVFSPEGKYLGLIDIAPIPFVSGLNIVAGEPNYLYASGRLGLYRIPLEYSEAVNIPAQN